MNKNYRIHTNIASDTLLQVNMRQDFDFMEILSLKLAQKDAYKIHSSNYGVIIGRVLANDAFGIPNAKVSVFIERDDDDTTELSNIYPYTEISGKDKEGRRYNLLPNYSDDVCYRVVGTFPNKRMLLDDTTYLEVYDKYWKYTTVTNNAGDYMIFGVPVGNQQIHVDIDMSDIGVLSQKPRDYMYKGYTETLFDSSTQFKESTNLDNLTQIFSQNKSIYVYPFWGDAENGIAAITRADIQINYKFEPTCVFMGSIVSDNDGNTIDHRCGATRKSGFNNQLVAGEGTIEMIRKTQDGLVEEFPIQGNRLIDNDGVWCYQIPMNLDFVGTDEYGNIVPTDNPSKGIPTRTQVRFRISKNETGGEGFSRHTAKYLVPMNPVLDEEELIPTTKEETGQDMEKMYLFGSNTPQSCFRDLYWNNVYSVKNFIPKTQTASRAYSPYYNALKAGNIVDNQNPLPFGKLVIDTPFTYMFICLLYSLLILIVYMINYTIINLLNFIINILNATLDALFFWGGAPEIPFIPCLSLNAGPNSDNIAFFPGCDHRGMDEDVADCPEGMENCKRSDDKKHLLDLIEYNLSQEYDVVRLDLYQDWINGCLYMPLWFWKKTKKKKFLFFTIASAKNEYCSCDREYDRLKTVYTCNIEYTGNSLDVNSTVLDNKENRWHKTRRKGIYFRNGLIKPVENNDGLTAYYYTAFQPSSNDKSQISNIKQRKTKFEIIRLFATDIILLGNLNESNIYGIPQLFNNIPSTTSNIPPIATIQESLEADDISKENVDNDIENNEGLTGKTIVTGMDWGYRGAEDAPHYKNGLFMDLSCFYADTRAKSCINVERMAELGVNLDVSHKMSYAKGNDIVEGVIDSDGFINKFEISDNDSRAMFATLNHIGFIPQDYQTDKGMYETQIMDNRTGYLIPKFKYTYPVDFDGRLQPIMEDYANGFAQPLYDPRDEAYLTFRFGAEADGKHGRMRHFYYHEEENKYEMPLYNNSFYFYFGINKGNTAIDKFYTKFVAPCAQNEKKPFTIDVTTQGKVECPDMYAIADYKKPFIKIKMDDINAPYYYELYDANSNLLVQESGKTDTEFTIPDPNNPKTKDIEITNQTYTLKVTDANGKKLSERIKVETPKVSIEFDTQRLGTKFYNIESTRVDYICNSTTMFYGVIRIKSFTIDGYIFDITNVEPIGYDKTTNSYILKLTGKNELTLDGTSVFTNTGLNQVIVYVSTAENKTSYGLPTSDESTNDESTNGVKNCLCDKNNPVATKQGTTDNISISTALPTSPMWLGKVAVEEGSSYIYPELYVYQPSTFILTTYQWCNDKVISDNSSSDMAVVQNGDNFNAYLNDMPVRFMLGTINDSKDGKVANESNFYRNSVVHGSAKDDGINGWYGVHQEDTYKFAPVDDKNKPIWDDYITLSNGITSSGAKKKVLQYKFKTMFSVAEAAYVTTQSSVRFYYHADGGVGIPLNRTVHPLYDSSVLSKEDPHTTYTLNDRSTVTGDNNYPNIVGNNYGNRYMRYDEAFDPYFNKAFENDYADQGNYFAVFSNNGGYTTNKKIDDKIPVIRIPNFTKITPTSDDMVKEIGKDIKGKNLDYFNPARNATGSSLPYFRAMFVDRRLDFDLHILAPSTGENIRLYPAEKKSMEKVWKGGRIFGSIYGGIEMSYDNDYNILSATELYEYKKKSDPAVKGNCSAYTENNSEYYKECDGRVKPFSQCVSEAEKDYIKFYDFESLNKVVKNNNYEYTMTYSDTPGEDAKTYYNETPLQFRRYYEAELNGFDIRDYFWSNNHKPENPTGTKISDGNTYIYQYPQNEMSLYNGYFSRRNIISQYGNYPTKRYIDVGNLPMVGGTSNLLLTSCGYNNMANIDSLSGELTLKASKGESIELEFAFKNPIRMVEPTNNDEKVSFANVYYSYKSKDNDGWLKFEAELITLMFKVNTFECSGYKVYNHTPKVIKVLPYIEGIDGISYYKTVTNLGNEDATYKARGTVESVLNEDNNNLVLHQFKNIGQSLWFGSIFGQDIITTEDVEPNDWYRNKRGEEVHGRFIAEAGTGDDPKILTSDANEWNNITFYKVITVKDAKIFTILLEREFESTGNDNLTKHIKTVETSSLFDSRHLLMSVAADETYIEVSPLTVSSSIDSEEGSTEEQPEISTNGKSFTQTFTLAFKFDFTKAPVDAQCEAFGDYNTMSYTVIFTDSKGESYSLTPADVYIESVENEENEIIQETLFLKTKWGQEMGVITDGNWSSNTVVTVMGKTKENFIYKLPDVRFIYSGDLNKDNMEVDNKYVTEVVFKIGNTDG